jgi:alkanesulfonate monooxygenase SsuD/methylene tetrahydromethanopterin reductase-like flavin-dependent oxidoreductase (luciferase family)
VKTGVTLQGVDHPDEFEKMAAEIEALGFDNLWLTDSSLHSRYCWAYLTLAARATSRLTLGTAVTNPVTRHPAMTAVAAATLAEISGGRTVLGIGAGDRPLLSLRHTPAKVGSLESAIASIRGLWTGEHVTDDALQDAHYRFPQTAPVYCRLAGLDQAIIDQVRASYSGGEFQEAARAAAALPVDFVKRMALAGGRAEAAAHIATLREIGVDSVTVFPLGPNRMATVRAFAEVVSSS